MHLSDHNNVIDKILTVPANSLAGIIEIDYITIGDLALTNDGVFSDMPTESNFSGLSRILFSWSTYVSNAQITSELK